MFDNHWQPYAWKPPGQWAIKWKTTKRPYDGLWEGWVYRTLCKDGSVLAQNANNLPTHYDSFDAALADAALWARANIEGDGDAYFTIVNLVTGEELPGEALV